MDESRIYLTHLECSVCGKQHAANVEQHLCSCGGILLARYDLAAVASDVPRDRIAARPWYAGLWRYSELLPVAPADRVTLGEGATPLLPLDWLGQELGMDAWLKDEGLNPTGAFKARGAAVGVSRAKALGARTIALPTAGNAGAAWAAYGARAGVPVIVAMPKDAPPLTQQEVALYGARLHLVDGLISDAGRWVAEGVAREGWYDASTFKEPYRLEGKKTLGLEIAEQLGWQTPDVILYPTGGGVGLLGLWKAFAELRELGWIASDRPAPRLVAVQAAGCAPVVRAWESGADTTAFWEGAQTIAAGLRVPGPLAGALMLRVLRETRGTAIAIEDEAIAQAMSELAGHGFWVCPEGAALLPAVRRLRASNWIRAGESVVLLNTGSGLVYPDVTPPNGAVVI
ncbi:MAG: Threonine-synthase-like protein 2 [Ktedonobacterales bacterium]|nr:MAG: Threonine-synthase-like protein 2 [Ktedonobacterales bacterium]